MKKLAIALFAVVCVAMFISPSFAEDRMSLSGQYYLRAYQENYSNGSDANYFHQRFRVQTTINIADDVKAVMRADYGDGIWGSGFTTNYNNGLVTRPLRGTANAIDIDRTYVQINKEMWQLTVGQQWAGLGIFEVLDANLTGAKLVIKLPVKTSLLYAKANENGSLNDDGNNGDRDLYAINFSYDTDAFSSDLFAATISDGSATDDSRTMYGINASGTLAMVNLTAELAIADGDYKNTTGNKIDYTGTQFYLKADTDINDAFSLGGTILYALGTDKTDEEQLTHISDWWSFTPMVSNTPEDTWLNANTPSGDSNPFDPTNSNGGVQGFNVFAKYTVMDGLSLGGLFGYAKPEEDANTATDHITTYNAWVSYAIATNSTVSLTYLASDFDNLSDNYEALVGTLIVNF